MAILPKKAVQQLRPYPALGEERYSKVRLDCNENTRGFPDAYPEGIPDYMVSAYPEYEKFIAKLSKYLGVSRDCFLLTNGSDEGILLTTLTFVEPGVDIALVSTPCFIVIPHNLRLCGAQLVEVPVKDDLSFDIDGIESALKQGVRIAMFATPENPTGAVLDEDIIKRWCQKFPDTLFVIDEAYGDFSGGTVLPLIESTANLLVLRTFSKAWGMAGLRLGVVLGCAELIEYVSRSKLLFSVNSAAIWTASRLLDRQAEVAAATAMTMARKIELEARLIERGYRLVTGKANSVLINMGAKSIEFAKFAREKNLLVRNLSRTPTPEPNGPKTWGYLRVSVGTQEENERFLAALDEFAKTADCISTKEESLK